MVPNRLADAVSPYLRSHSDNPVDWWAWGEEPFAEAVRRDVPVLVSIGYSTCHWCHVMARESFSDPELAAHLNDRFVAIKVDREEHPDVDAAYLAAAGAFSEQLGWPLTVFVTPEGRTFYAGTYFPPQPVEGRASFRQVLDAVTDAWTDRRAEVEDTAGRIVAALAAAGERTASDLPGDAELTAVVRELIGYEDRVHGGFGGAPKFPVAPVLGMLLDRGSLGDRDARGLAERTLAAMAGSALRDPVEGGYFRYATRPDWTEPHYERMLYDNALLLGCHARLAPVGPEAGNEHTVAADGVARFLADVLRRPGGAFASAQDSESVVDGERTEGGYYALDAAGRARQHPPALDDKVLTGWNGLAIAALADAGARLSRPEWVTLARAAADHLLARHRRAHGTLVRAAIGDRLSSAPATLEDHGMLANGLLAVALATGEASYAAAARELVDATMTDAGGAPFAVPGGADRTLAERGLAIASDPSEGAYPSGLSATAAAAHRLHLLTADPRYRAAATAAMRSVAAAAASSPIGFGAALATMTALAAPVSQLVVVAEESDRGPGSVASVARGLDRAGAVTAVVTAAQAEAFAAAGFELFEGRRGGAGGLAYLCHDFVCDLPRADADELERALRG